MHKDQASARHAQLPRPLFQREHSATFTFCSSCISKMTHTITPCIYAVPRSKIAKVGTSDVLLIGAAPTSYPATVLLLLPGNRHNAHIKSVKQPNNIATGTIQQRQDATITQSNECNVDYHVTHRLRAHRNPAHVVG
ncbi:hypothetical protein FG476_06420 [Xylella fastidiosa subsp. multiplex]|uniref:Uncharacterized protein n=1 Tax=Xylella fastidiosa subsp. multiplex TaxID=644357 RepID=A0A9Q4MI04_XYLFS|nr:hypothetical protein [Xylella fastidiosa subsp. multiplex]MRT47017.1 hypothetical protein [Xylella fastidiosa subsp. multiplex]MRT53226.1 hypothetical protein [Xylella fastidiosa subsp. multiplex]MRT97224.1 hypothetical protein [Xylella fastidiosa subsp. multiplex]MRU23723.1 hypothetical protein [Xylella fastidiosa subsp. multiplex]